jgi:hypothetical protein
VKDNDFTGALAVMGLFGVVPVALALMFASARLGPASIPIWIATAGAAWMIMKGPVGMALASRLQADSGEKELQGETLAELEDLRSRVAELEERVDFSERLLAQKAEAPRLEGHGA